MGCWGGTWWVQGHKELLQLVGNFHSLQSVHLVRINYDSVIDHFEGEKSVG